MTGFTYSLPEHVRKHNELRTLLGLVVRNPFNAYWRARLFGALLRAANREGRRKTKQ